MSNLFGNVSNDPRIQRQALASKYNAARSNLILLVIFSAINLIMLATNAGTYFLFSASVPYLITGLGMFFCGMAPEEAYEGLDGMYFMDKSLFVIMFIISMLILVLYLLCWLFSKNNKVKWLITALVLFGIDTLVMFAYYGISPDMIIDVIFHVWVIVILAMGIDAHYKLKKMPVEEVMIEAEYTELPEEAAEGAIDGERKTTPDSTPLRDADNEVKAKILLESEIYGHFITYRRIKRTNELVIDGKVYAEYIALAEMPHMLTATVDGHNIAAGMDNTSHSFILVDGQTVKTKLRLI
jgi:hypothetical protein